MMAVACGGMAGATVRWAISDAVPTSRFHWGTLLVNCIGSLLLGVLAERFIRSPPTRPNLGLALTAGFCGSLTTFSALAVAIAMSLQRGALGDGAFIAASNCLLGIGLAAFGVKAQRRFGHAPDQ